MTSQLKANCSLVESTNDRSTAKALLAIAGVRYQAFCDRFGRAPGFKEPLLFDPNSEEPIIASPAEQVRQVISAATIANVDPIVALDFLGLAPVNRICEE